MGKEKFDTNYSEELSKEEKREIREGMEEVEDIVNSEFSDREDRPKREFKKEKFEPEFNSSPDSSKVRVIVTPLEGRLSMGREEDVLYQLVLIPTCEEVTIKGKTLSVNFVKGLEGLKYCSMKKIPIKTMAHYDDFIMVNGNIQVKTDGNSESVELEKAIFWSEDKAIHEADKITKETLKRIEYLIECLEGARNVAKTQTKNKIY